MPDLSKIKLNDTTYNLKDAALRERYGVCNTAGDTAAKTVVIDSVTSLYEGLYIFVKFANANTIASPTLQVNSLDAKPIKRYGTTAPSTSAASSWNAGSVVLLIYDGTYWQMEEWNNTTYSSMTTSEISAGTGTTARIITPARLKIAVETWAPIQSVNGDTGSVIVDQLQTTAGNDNTEYNLIGTNTSNTNNAAVDIYNPGLISFSKYDNNFARLTLGSTTTPGELRLYTSASGASGYIDLKSAASSTNTRTITLPDATGTVALTSDIPSVSSWALAANKPSYTFSELTTTPTSIGGYGITDAYTKTEVDGLVSGVLHYKGTKATVSALPSSGNTTGDTWHVTADGSEWAWDGSDWQELGTAVDLSGYVPTSRTVNGKALTSDISLTASDVSALPSSTTYVSSFNGESGAITYTAPVTSVNGQTGAVTIADSDEKVKYTDLNGTNSAKPVLLAYSQTANGQSLTNTAYTSNKIMWNDYGQTLYIYNSDRSKYSNLTASRLGLSNSASSYSGFIQTAALTAARTYTLPDKGGTLALTSDIPTTASDVGALADDCAAAGITSTDISNWNAKLDSYTETDPTVPSWAKESSKPTYTASEVGAAESNHTHGNITNEGDITTNATIASGDRLIINDESAGQINNSSITFGSSTTSFLANDGTWQTPTDTKNTAGSTSTSSKIYLVGTTAMDTYSQTYANANLYYNYGLHSTSSFNDSDSWVSQSSKSINLKVDDSDYDGYKELHLSGDDVHLLSSGNGIAIDEFGATTITGVVTPTTNDMAANKKYVDDAVAGITDTNTTYTISISGNVITLTPSSGTAQTITLPVYNGGVE